MTKTTFDEEVGLRIYTIRRQRRLKQWELAELAGIHHNMVSRIELAQTSPRLDTLRKIANALDVELWSLLPWGE
jgi:transcriptional regulator with XRE-family HTH domain